MTLGVFPRGNPAGSAILVTGHGFTALADDLTVGGVSAHVQYKTDTAMMLVVPALSPGPSTLNLGNGSSTQVEVLFSLSSTGWQAPLNPIVPILLPYGYVNPVDKFWQNDVDQSDIYAFQLVSDSSAPIVEFENNPQGRPARGTYDKATGLVRFCIDLQGQPGPAADAGSSLETPCPAHFTSFIGVYSYVAPDAGELFHKLVMFPDASDGPQLILSVEE